LTAAKTGTEREEAFVALQADKLLKGNESKQQYTTSALSCEHPCNTAERTASMLEKLHSTNALKCSRPTHSGF